MFNLFGNKEQVDFRSMIADGAMIIDVRTRGEYQGDHVKGSKNIPLNTIDQHVEELRSAGKPIILCCASGNRSGQATRFLKSNGVEAYNGGSWFTVNNYCN